jgi:predicted  nucleic acid-binding Zn-ribbon protein
MKTLKFTVIVLLGFLIVTGCESKKKEQQILDLQAINAQLVTESGQKDSLMNELINSINDIERNLSDITAREKLITDAPNDEKRMNIDVREKIMDEIILINNIMDENKKRLAALKDQLKKSDTKIAALEETIQLLTKRIEEKEYEIAALKDELVRLNFKITALNSTVDTLREQTASQTKVISQQDALIGEMNTIWYVVGEKKELSDKGIIEKASGLFGGDMVMSNMINPDYFTTADMRKITKISFKSKKVELVTVHPEGSYKFIEENEMITGLEILNSGEFWKSSRFLVIMTR